MKFTDRIRAFLAPRAADGGTSFTPGEGSGGGMEFAQGRPRAIEGESMVLGNDLLAAMTTVDKGGIYFMPSDEIVRRKGWAIYKEMLNDDQVKSCLAFKKILIAGRTFEIAPADESPDAKKQADFVLEALNRVSVNDVFTEALSALEFGYSFAEKVYARDKWDADGLQYVFLKKIAHRDPEQIYLQADVHGNVTGAQQYNSTMHAGSQINLTPEKFWLFTHNKRFGNNFGVSDLRAAYRPWWAKKFIINFWNVFLERMGSPMTVMKYPQGASDDLKNTLKKIMRGLSSKTEILIPEGVEIDLVEATRSGTAGYADALLFHDNSIARAVLMTGLWGQNDSGARQTQGNSQGFIHLRLLFKMADTISQQLQKSLMDQVVRPLLEINFASVKMPRFIWQDYGQFEGQVVADEIRQLHAAGLIDMDQKDVNYVRSIMGLPLRGPDDKPDEVIRPEPLPPPGNGTPPPAAPPGNDRAGKGGATQKDGANQGKDKTNASEDKTYALVLKEVERE